VLAAATLAALAGPTQAWAGPPVAGGPPVTVLAAASLTDAIEEIAAAYEAAGGGPVRRAFAASLTLAKQIAAGAPADVFVAADAASMDHLATRDRLVPGTRRPLLGNRLVLVVPATKPQTVEIAPGGDWLAQLPAGRIATGDPAHVPVGRYAQAALTRLGVWPAVEARLARAGDPRAALVLVARGEAAAGIVYATDARVTPAVHVAATFPADSHGPIVYPIAIVRGRDTPAARRVYDHLVGSERARATFTRHGFTLP
jgi:molybdate transport system substrate-binding protein